MEKPRIVAGLARERTVANSFAACLGRGLLVLGFDDDGKGREK